MPNHEEVRLQRGPADHPAQHKLEIFMRGGGLVGEEARAIVRHLLTGCPQCVTVTRRLWNLGDPSRALKVLAEEAAADVARRRRTFLYLDSL